MCNFISPKLFCHMKAGIQADSLNLSWSDMFSYQTPCCSQKHWSHRLLQQYKDRKSRLQGLQKYSQFPTVEHAHVVTNPHCRVDITAVCSMCYFAKCNPGQDNKMASRHFVNISALAWSAPGGLLTDGCVDWFFFFHKSSALVCQTAWVQVRGKCTGRIEGLTNANQFIKIKHKASIGGRLDAAHQCLWFVQRFVKEETARSIAVILSGERRSRLMLRRP